MKLHSLTIKNIKTFSGEHIFDFSQSEKINTVSGINGSGKTTVFKTIVLAQKLFFAEQFNLETDKIIDYSKDLLSVFTSKDSFIRLEFKFDNDIAPLASFTIRCDKKSKEKVTAKFESTEDDLNQIKKFWNIHNPTNLILYIDSNRNILENDFSNENIQLSQNENELAIEYIFEPEKIFLTTYERIIKDYIRERVIPSTPRADLPHFVSKILIHDTLNYLKISNFTALERRNQFTLQIIGANGTKSSSYDVRNLSSGERTLFYIYHFICYVKNIGMLIIDEPENNLHENMLSNFVTSLNEICNNEDFSQLILETAKKTHTQISNNIKNQIKAFYKNHKLSQIFLLTHSKNLLYNNFTLGKNYIVDNGMATIEYDNYEKKLREIGLSKTINKVLFVEGQTENELLESILSPHNIKVKSLGGCGEVIETYKRYLKIQDHIRDVQFCFLIDKDTRSDEDINSIRSKNQPFFDEHFIVMDRHEIENYFLEAKMFHELYLKHKTGYESIIVPAVHEIEDKIKNIALAKKEMVLKKKIRNLNQQSLSKIKLAISNRAIPVDNKENYDNYIETIFTGSALHETINDIKQNYESLSSINSDWDSKWLKLCDGKSVFYEYLNTVVNDLQIQNKRARKELEEIGLHSSEYEINSIVENILRILK